jgi:hypothetical protein
MEPVTLQSRHRTAIPSRFVSERERVLRILARWEATTAACTIRLVPEGIGAGVGGQG